MKKKPGSAKERASTNRETMRDEYDFSSAVPYRSTERYRRFMDAVILEPDVKKLFPDSAAVNEALRAYARVLKRRRPRRRSRSA